MKIKLITDSASDLPLSYIEANAIEVVSLEVNIKGTFYKDDLGQTLAPKTFYDLLRDGEHTSTSQVNSYTFEEIFERYIQEGYEIIYIGLASKLSGTVHSARSARAIVKEKYPQASITIIDSKSASLGEGLLVYYACEMLKKGETKDEVIKWVEATSSKVIHSITVDDLSYLKRGGRISGVSSAVGTLLHIKPIIKLDEEGKVVPSAKVKGTKKVYQYLVDQIKEQGVNLEQQVVFICHGDAKDKAETLKQLLLEETSVKDVWIQPAGAVIGSHVGPGALAMMFIGEKR